MTDTEFQTRSGFFLHYIFIWKKQCCQNVLKTRKNDTFFFDQHFFFNNFFFDHRIPTFFSLYFHWKKKVCQNFLKNRKIDTFFSTNIFFQVPSGTGLNLQQRSVSNGNFTTHRLIHISIRGCQCPAGLPLVIVIY